jgi:hypothetical protein
VPADDVQVSTELDVTPSAGVYQIDLLTRVDLPSANPGSMIRK